MPIGFLFGFFLERSDLCGASAFSEVVVMRDWRKFFGIWVVIVVSMVVFALGDVLGLVHLNPKPLFWASALGGGVIFGVGIVLAGGCISGVLFKAGQGNLNSMVAGSYLSARLRGNFRLLPKPPDETIVAFLGGLMVGAGAALGGV